MWVVENFYPRKQVVESVFLFIDQFKKFINDLGILGVLLYLLS